MPRRSRRSSGSSSASASDLDDVDDDLDDQGASGRPLSCTRRLLTSCASALFRPVREIWFLASWMVWLLSSVTLGTGQGFIVLYSAIRITISLVLYLGVIVAFRVHAYLHWIQCKALCYAQRHVPRAERIRLKKLALEEATTLESWQRLALDLDHLCGHDAWKANTSGADCDYKLLRHVSAELMQFRQAADWRGLQHSLSVILNRQFCNLGSELLYSRSFHGTKFCVESFYCQVVEQLSFLATQEFGPEFPTRAKLRFFQRARRTLGKTVWCLSGGGALAMYHCGVARAMVRGNCLPSIINGTSGGSIIAALIGTRTDAELRDPEFLSPSICTRYGEENRWLPTLQQQVHNFVHDRVLMDYRVFQKSAQVIFGADQTFEDAYRRTQRELSITVTWSLREFGKAHPLVLNHVSSPNVFVWSAVTCSCALPGLMKPQRLMCRGPDGNVAEFSPSGAEVVDGSLQADIPVQRLTELFNAQHFIISQTNPHVIDFVRDGHEGKGRSSVGLDSTRRPWLGPQSRAFRLLTGLEKFLQADVAHRLMRLAKLKVIPKIYRQDFSHVLTGNQRYTGDVTIVPKIPFLMRLKALTHPSVEDMEEYFRGGEAAAFPKISRIQNGLLLERTLEECVRSLTKQLKREQTRRARRQQRHQVQAQAEQTGAVHVDSPVCPVMAPTHHHPPAHSPLRSPVAMMHHSPPPLTGVSGSPPRRSHKGGALLGSILLPDAMSTANSRSPGANRILSRSMLSNGSNSILTPTASVLAHLPMHGATDATDTETDQASEAGRNGGATHANTTSSGSTSSTSGSLLQAPHHASSRSRSHSHGGATLPPHAHARARDAFSGPVSSGSSPYDDESSLSSGGGGGGGAAGDGSYADASLSLPHSRSESRASTASLADFDADEAANHEILMTDGDIDEEHAIAGHAQKQESGRANASSSSPAPSAAHTSYAEVAGATVAAHAAATLTTAALAAAAPDS